MFVSGLPRSNALVYIMPYIQHITLNVNVELYLEDIESKADI